MLRFLALFLFLLLPAAAQARDVLPGPITGEVLEIIDGDTFRAKLHIWVGQHIEILVRVEGIDTPEKRGKCASERVKAEQARQALEKLLQNGFSLTDIRNEKYAGRVLAKVAASGRDVAGQLQAAGHARVYKGGKRGGWCE